jgi:hypothetical protein
MNEKGNIVASFLSNGGEKEMGREKRYKNTKEKVRKPEV